MGFRFQKRIKLGKGFGLNFSKSGINSSWRTKHGTFGSKGYSVRTGIPGLTYRKTFSKTKNTGCLLFLVFILSVSFFTTMISCKNEKLEIEKWYQGGTLHKSKIIEWKNATESNKLATCGDFLAKINKNSSLAEIKIKAENLRICINEAVKNQDITDNYKVSEVASMCILLLEN